MCPRTKFSNLGPDPVHKLLTLVVDGSIQPPVELICKERNILAATFVHSLHKNIGGSETFQNKVNFFHRELWQVYMKRPHSEVTLKVSRHALLESSLKATQNFSILDWSKNFEVVFQNEEALDWEGPLWEWFELICKALFDTTNQLFTRFNDTNHALMYPNPNPCSSVPEDVWVCRAPGGQVSLWVLSRRSLQTVGPSSLHPFFLGPNHSTMYALQVLWNRWPRILQI